MGIASEIMIYWKTKLTNLFLILKHFYPISISEYVVENKSTRSMSIAVHFHVYYPEYFEQIEIGKSNFPDATFFISVPNKEMLRLAKAKFPHVQSKNVKVVPNRGRNFAPLLLTFGKDLLDFDLVIHLHSKADYGSLRRKNWSAFLWENLYLNAEKVEYVRRVFESDPQIGLYYPLDLRWMPSVFGWDGSEEIAKRVFSSYNDEIAAAQTLDYPIGGMFWTRRENLELMMKFVQDLELFPPEEENQHAIQNGITLEHSVERFISISNLTNGFVPLIYLARGKKFTVGFIESLR